MENKDLLPVRKSPVGIRSDLMSLVDSQATTKTRRFNRKVLKIKRYVKKQRQLDGEDFYDSSDDSLVQFDMQDPDKKSMTTKKPIEQQLQKNRAKQYYHYDIFADEQINHLMSKNSWARNWRDSNLLKRSIESNELKKFRSAL